MPHRSLPAAALVLLLAAPLLAQDPPRPASRLHELGFMTGCWQGRSPNGSTIEEHYTAPSNNLMLGMTRYLRDGATRSFEFTMIGNVSGGSHLIPHPGGKASVTFTETERSANRVVWENPAHDFPQRISYERFAPDSLRARVELMNGGNATEYRMGRVACGG